VSVEFSESDCIVETTPPTAALRLGDLFSRLLSPELLVPLSLSIAPSVECKLSVKLAEVSAWEGFIVKD
jgi:hypothetical protein